MRAPVQITILLFTCACVVQKHGLRVKPDDEEDNRELNLQRAGTHSELQLWAQKMNAIATEVCNVYSGSLSTGESGHGSWAAPSSSSWGNLLSEYWEARAAALLAGVPFKGTRMSPASTWLSYLPIVSPPDTALKNMSALSELCNSCTSGMYPHECNGKWTRIRKQIVVDTQSALHEYARDSGVSLPRFGPREAVVHIRMETTHSMIEWPGKQYFKEALPPGIEKIHFLTGSRHPKKWESISRFYMSLLSEVCGGCQVEDATGTQFDDFAKLARAPTVLCGSSTYCLWAAMGNPGVIYFPDNMAGGSRPFIDDTWHWIEGKRLPNRARCTGYETLEACSEAIKKGLVKSDVQWLQQMMFWARDN